MYTIWGQGKSFQPFPLQEDPDESGDDGVTPAEQANLRASTRGSRAGKRGRPKKNPDSKTVSKKSPKAKAKAKPAMKVKTIKNAMKSKPRQPKSTAPKRKPRASKKPAVDDQTDDQPQPDGGEVESGRRFGCGRCRFAALGCKTCKRPGYKPHNRRRSI